MYHVGTVKDDVREYVNVYLTPGEVLALVRGEDVTTQNLLHETSDPHVTVRVIEQWECPVCHEPEPCHCLEPETREEGD